jgi:transposase-like protein
MLILGETTIACRQFSEQIAVPDDRQAGRCCCAVALRIQEVARYGQAYKDRIVARLLPPESSSVKQLSREVGVSAATLERWRAGALAHGSGDRTGGSQRWTAAARLQALITTAGMDEATRSGWCREQGLYPAELAAWQQDAIAGLGEPRAVSAVEARQDRRRVKDLERELHRKDRALAETAALLVLSKNSRRSSTRTRTIDPSGRPPDPDA